MSSFLFLGSLSFFFLFYTWEIELNVFSMPFSHIIPWSFLGYVLVFHPSFLLLCVVTLWMLALHSLPPWILICHQPSLSDDCPFFSPATPRASPSKDLSSSFCLRLAHRTSLFFAPFQWIFLSLINFIGYNGIQWLSLCWRPLDGSISDLIP